jgi:O-antigen ligase
MGMLNVFRRATIIGKLRYLLLDRYYNQSVPTALISLCILATLFSSLQWRDYDNGGSPLPALIPIIAMAGLGFVTVVYNNMEQFGVFIILVTILVSDGISTGTDTKITFGLTLLALWTSLWLFKMIVVERSIKVRYSPANIPALVFIVILIISLIWSGQFAETEVMYMYADKVAVRLMTTVVIIVSIATFFLYANNIQSVNTLRAIVGWFIFIGAAFVVINLGAGGLPRPLNSRGQFAAWVGIFALGQTLFNDTISKRRKIFYLLILVGWVVAIMRGTGLSWLSGWMPLTIGCLVLMFLYSRRLFFVMVLISVTLYVGNEVLLQDVAAQESQVSGETRLDAWMKVVNVTLRHPLFGTGPVGYFFYFTVNIGGFFQLAHNNYIDIFAQTGILGFTVWLIMWAGMGIMTLRMWRIVPKHKQFEHALANTLLACYVCTVFSMMLGDWVTPFPYTQTLSGFDYTIWHWMLAGMTVALYYVTKQSQGEAEAVSNENSVVIESDYSKYKRRSLSGN